jgi:hypothetical protein
MPSITQPTLGLLLRIGASLNPVKPGAETMRLNIAAPRKVRALKQARNHISFKSRFAMGKNNDGASGAERVNFSARLMRPRESRDFAAAWRAAVMQRSPRS